MAFHAQQAAEKALKAHAYHLGGEPDRTHSLSDLTLKSAELDPSRGRGIPLKHQPRLAELQKHAIRPRSTDAPPVSGATTRDAVATVSDLLGDVVAITAPGSTV